MEIVIGIIILFAIILVLSGVKNRSTRLSVDCRAFWTLYTYPCSRPSTPYSIY
ncbi:Uncharacterised protein [Proteus mirabilis]|uniref:Uncharacterized protein n=1 Tax=Proteus mirabilis TaxID=584 RepID=A0A2X2C0W9_PROMI|nr:Uncharacterised protein [Proteus mirabilis]